MLAGARDDSSLIGLAFLPEFALAEQVERFVFGISCQAVPQQQQNS